MSWTKVFSPPQIYPCHRRNSPFVFSRSKTKNTANIPASQFPKIMSSAASAEATVTDAPPPQESQDVIVQYVVLRRDLIDKWPLGSIVTQGCHASVAALWSHRQRKDTLDYVSDDNINSMHKVTLEVKGETQIKNLSEKLEAGGIEHKLWMEQPENIPTCIATRPYPKSQVASFFKKLKLCK